MDLNWDYAKIDAFTTDNTASWQVELKGERAKKSDRASEDDVGSSCGATMQFAFIVEYKNVCQLQIDASVEQMHFCLLPFTTISAMKLAAWCNTVSRFAKVNCQHFFFSSLCIFSLKMLRLHKDIYGSRLH